MIDFDKIRWLQYPKPRRLEGAPTLIQGPNKVLSLSPFVYVIRFVPESYRPPVYVGYAIIQDPVEVKAFRRRFRRELRKIVKQFGHVPKKVNPFWWTPKNTKLIVEEVRG